jgi:hypothetical protein
MELATWCPCPRVEKEGTNVKFRHSLTTVNVPESIQLAMSVITLALPPVNHTVDVLDVSFTVLCFMLVDRFQNQTRINLVIC